MYNVLYAYGTDKYTVFILIQTFEHRLINRIINDVIDYADQISGSFSRILFFNLKLRLIWGRLFQRPTG